MRAVLAVSVAAAAALALAPMAQAEVGDRMYRVGVDIQPGEYMYTVSDYGIGSWELCSTANCDLETGLMDMDQIFGAGATGYLSVTAGARYLKTSELMLQPA
ncbi:hypothetical protein SEA_NANOSMITE_1 [Mycobacterium phage Nanosmite]|nr:hypothetical protein SEA_NANOSMITE_1 [Mycobacterium phage Nanosmite]